MISSLHEFVLITRLRVLFTMFTSVCCTSENTSVNVMFINMLFARSVFLDDHYFVPPRRYCLCWERAVISAMSFPGCISETTGRGLHMDDF